MRILKQFRSAAWLVAALSLPTAAPAAAPAALDESGAQAIEPTVAAPLEYKLGTEVVVRNWVLCTTQIFAESIVKARVAGVEAALKVYGDLTKTKSCGQMPELHVILREPVYQSEPGQDYDSRVFAASVSIGGGWPTAFLVSGSLPDKK